MAKSSQVRSVEEPESSEPEAEVFAAPRTEQITIAGQTFTVPCPYEEGHVVTAGEAQAMNQILHENIRNNFTKKVKSGEASQADVDAYAANFKMGVRRGGGGRRGDQVRRLAVQMAREKVIEAIRARGDKPSQIRSADITARAVRAVDENPRFLEAAKQELETRKSLGDITV